MVHKELRSLIKKIPQGAKIPCKYRFRGGPVEEGLLYSTREAVYLKHNCGYSHHGDGQQIEGYNYSWFLYRYSANVFDLDDIEDIFIGNFCFTIGEL